MKINRRLGVRLTLRLLREGGSLGKKRNLEVELANLRANHVRLKDNVIVGISFVCMECGCMSLRLSVRILHIN